MEYDYIIVGAGTAGCVAADALTQSGQNRVLLIEAGGKPSSPFVSIPAGFAKLFKSRLDWAFETVPQHGAGERRIFVPRGRMLGGSANLNAQIHQWGHPADYVAWADNGAPGWSWRDVAPHFEAMENVAGHAAPGRGRTGPMHVCVNPHAHHAAFDFVEAARAGAGSTTNSYNGEHYEGAWIAEIAHHGGKRFSAWDAFLKPAMRRRNLHVITGCHVSRLIIDDGRAVGVELTGEVVQKELRARAGIVLATGAIGSPTILMRSGLGPAAQLHRHGIKVVRDMPGVGANLHDHAMAVFSFPTLHTDTYKTAEKPLNLLRYIALRQGPLASNAAEAIAFARSRPSLSAPDMELIFAPFEWRNEALDPPAIHAFSIGAALAHPKSRGSVALRDSDPLASPVIDFGLFTDSEGADRFTKIEAVHWAHRVARSPAMARHLMPIPDLSNHPEEVFDQACAVMQTVYHPAGTCRMGLDADAVVAADLSVHGIRGLWIGDASIMPQLPRGHPNAAVAMIGARAAAFAEATAEGRPAISFATHQTQGAAMKFRNMR